MSTENSPLSSDEIQDEGVSGPTHDVNLMIRPLNAMKPRGESAVCSGKRSLPFICHLSVNGDDASNSLFARNRSAVEFY